MRGRTRATSWFESSANAYESLFAFLAPLRESMLLFVTKLSKCYENVINGNGIGFSIEQPGNRRKTTDLELDN